MIAPDYSASKKRGNINIKDDNMEEKDTIDLKQLAINSKINVTSISNSQENSATRLITQKSQTNKNFPSVQ